MKIDKIDNPTEPQSVNHVAERAANAFFDDLFAWQESQESDSGRVSTAGIVDNPLSPALQKLSGALKPLRERASKEQEELELGSNSQRADELAVAAEALLEQRVKEGLGVPAVFRFKDGDVVLVRVSVLLLVAELNVEVDLIRDVHGLRDGLWEVTEDVRHLGARPEEQGVRVELEAVLLGLLGASVDTEEHVLRLTVLMS